MYIALVTVYVIICFFLILVVLLQQGKGADIAGAFGGGGSQTAFGARGATTFLHKLTTGAFIGFVVLSMLLSILEARPRSSVIKTLPAGRRPQKAAGSARAAGSGSRHGRDGALVQPSSPPRRGLAPAAPRPPRRAPRSRRIRSPVPSWWNW